MDFANETAAGGRKGHIGIDGQNSGITNIANVPVETIETEFPIRVEEYGLLADSEGAGQYRGGLGMVRRYRFLLDDTTVQVRSDRMKTAPYGIKGGQPARKSRIHVVSDGKKQSKPSKFMVTVNAGDAMEIQWPGAGGWGDPLSSDPNQILNDVMEEKISLHRARSTYGVVIREEARDIDFIATEALRQALRCKS
jgi:N-methylhydantoinase B